MFALRIGRQLHSANEHGVAVGRREYPESSEVWTWAQVVVWLHQHGEG